MEIITTVLILLIYASIIGVATWAIVWPFEDKFRQAIVSSSKTEIARGIVAFWFILISISFVVIGVGETLGVSLFELLNEL